MEVLNFSLMGVRKSFTLEYEDGTRLKHLDNVMRNRIIFQKFEKNSYLEIEPAQSNDVLRPTTLFKKVSFP